jgi:hypothetical protein
MKLAFVISYQRLLPYHPMLTSFPEGAIRTRYLRRRIRLGFSAFPVPRDVSLALAKIFE